MKKLKQYLLNNGYQVEKVSYTGMGGIKVSNEYYKRNGKCIRFCKIGVMDCIITLYTEWEKETPRKGKEHRYGATLADARRFAV